MFDEKQYLHSFKVSPQIADLAVKIKKKVILLEKLAYSTSNV
jgi:hypothetical protein